MVEIGIRRSVFLGGVDETANGEVYVYFSGFDGIPKVLEPGREYYLRIYRIGYGIRGKNIVLFSADGSDVIDLFDERFFTEKIALIDKHYAGGIMYKVKVEADGTLRLAKAVVSDRSDAADITDKRVIIGIWGELINI